MIPATSCEAAALSFLLSSGPATVPKNLLAFSKVSSSPVFGSQSHWDCGGEVVARSVGVALAIGFFKISESEMSSHGRTVRNFHHAPA